MHKILKVIIWFWAFEYSIRVSIGACSIGAIASDKIVYLRVAPSHCRPIITRKKVNPEWNPYIKTSYRV